MNFDALKREYINMAAKQLANEGYNLIVKAFEESDYKHDKTQNLHDSYGCCVYYNKQIKEERYLTPRAVKAKRNYYSGRDEYGKDVIKEYFNNHTPPSNGLNLVIAAAMFYGRILEDGTYGRGEVRRKYKVITFMSDDVQRLAEKYKGKVTMLNG